MRFKALSVVAPAGSRIASGEKTLEVRSWLPKLSPDEDLVIVENRKYLRNEGETDPDGDIVAIVQVGERRRFVEADIPAACASSWAEGYHSWELKNVRPCRYPRKVLAARGIYELELEFPYPSNRSSKY